MNLRHSETEVNVPRNEPSKYTRRQTVEKNVSESNRNRIVSRQEQKMIEWYNST